MNRENNEKLLSVIGEIDERYITEYLNAGTQRLKQWKLHPTWNKRNSPGTKRSKTDKKSLHPLQNERSNISKHRPRQTASRFSIALASAVVLMLGTVSLAAVPVIGHFLANLANENRAVIQNFDEIEAAHGVRINDTQTCNGVTGTLNSAVLEDKRLLLSYTFDWSGLEEARDGSFHTYFLPWFFYITDGEQVLCQSAYTMDLHTQVYLGESDIDEDAMTATHLYCIELNDITGQELVGKELTVKLLYTAEGEGFVSTFTPEACYTDRSWEIGRTYEFGEHQILLERVEESALYVTLFIDCDTIGHDGNDYQFMLSDGNGNDYTVYPYGANDLGGYWFTKPETMSSELVLKVIRSKAVPGSYDGMLSDEYEVVFEIPIEIG